jgi:hypothetical protein
MGRCLSGGDPPLNFTVSGLELRRRGAVVLYDRAT